MKIILPYSPWWLLLIIAISVGLAMLLYFKNPYDSLSILWKKILLVTRSITFFLLFFLLLSPFIEKNKKIIYPPEIITLIDNSQSIKVDPLYTSIQPTIQEFFNKYSKNIIFDNYSFSDKIQNNLTFSFDGKATNLYDALQLALRQANEKENIKAILLFTDGINTQNNDPHLLFNQMKVPIYTIGLGDTTVHTDLIVSKIECNDKIPIGSTFPIEVVLNAKQAKGKSSKLQIFLDNELIYNEIININYDNFSKIITLQSKANNEGLHRIKVIWDRIDDEKNIINNSVIKTIEIIKQKYKIGILSCSTHPDIGAINRALSGILLNEVQLIRPGKDQIPNDLDVLIIYQLNGNCLSKQNMEQLKTSHTPIWLFIGTQTQIPLTTLFVPWLGNLVNSSYIESQVKVNEQFPYFQLSYDEINFFENAPPIMTLYPRNIVSNKFPIIFYQKIGNAISNNPVMFFYQLNNKNIAVFIGEGIWRWRVDALKNNSNVFDLWVAKIINYLLSTSNKDRFRIITESIYQSTEAINIQAELLNQSGELINYPDIEITINSNKGFRGKYYFSRTGNAYTLSLGQLPPDTYTYSATALLKDNPLTTKGTFAVEQSDIEMQNLTADHDLLKQISKFSGGRFFTFTDLDSLDKILQSEQINQTYYTIEKTTIPLIQSWVYLIIIIALLSFEWFIRKYMGGY